jgi:hypothetical protein
LGTQITRRIDGDPNYNSSGGEKGLKRRWAEQVNGKYDPYSDEWGIHNDIILGLEGTLRDLLKQFNDDDCGPPPVADAWTWATRGPVPDLLWHGNRVGSVPFIINLFSPFLVLTEQISDILLSVPPPPPPTPILFPFVTSYLVFEAAP